MFTFVVFVALFGLAAAASIKPDEVVASVEMECFEWNGQTEDFGAHTYNNKVYTTDQGGDNYNNGKKYVCCGLTADGNKHCAPHNAWSVHEGKYRLCEENAKQAEKMIKATYYRDVCCDSSWINSCGQCGAFIHWPFADTDELIKKENGFYNGTEWSDKYYDPEKDSEIYPNGFMGAVLRSENQPPVCVFIPDAAGRTILINVEPEEQNNRLCVGDLSEDDSEKTNPGFQKTCDTTSVSSCVHDGTIRGTVNTVGQQGNQERSSRGITFKIDCNSGCVEQSDTYLWFRVLFSKNSYQNPGIKKDGEVYDKDMTNAADNPEMFCEYVLRDYPFLSSYPSDLDAEVPVFEEAEEDASFSVFSGLFVALFFFVM